MNDTFAALGLLNWKPIIGALLLPPVPLLVLVLIAWRVRVRRAWLGGSLLVLALAGLWLSHCQAIGALLERPLATPGALTSGRIAELRRSLAGHRPVVLVLGGGALALAPEYGEAHLADAAFQRLHYGIWLARQLGAPLMVTGGVGHGQSGGPSEAAVAARIALRDYNVTLRWQEAASRDTRENARLSLLMLRPEGITDVLLVTHGWHMKRTLRAFEEAAINSGFQPRLLALPMGMGTDTGQPVQRWLPSVDGYRRVHQALREMVGLLMGA